MKGNSHLSGIGPGVEEMRRALRKTSSVVGKKQVSSCSRQEGRGWGGGGRWVVRRNWKNSIGHNQSPEERSSLAFIQKSTTLTKIPKEKNQSKAVCPRNNGKWQTPQGRSRNNGLPKNRKLFLYLSDQKKTKRKIREKNEKGPRKVLGSWGEGRKTPIEVKKLHQSHVGETKELSVGVEKSDLVDAEPVWVN